MARQGDKSTTEGRRLLLRALEAITQADLAKKIGTSQQLLSVWASGKNRPGHAFRLALSREVGIPPESWLTARERKIAKAA